MSKNHCTSKKGLLSDPVCVCISQARVGADVQVSESVVSRFAAYT